MIPTNIQVSRSKVKVKGHVDLLYIVQLITQQCFVLQAENLVGR